MDSGRPPAVERLDQYLAASRLAHEVIWDLHDALIEIERYDDAARATMDEAARIAVTEIPGLLKEAQRLRTLWDEQSLLDPEAAATTAQQLQTEMDRLVPELERLRDRQAQIAREFKRLTDDG